jgi:CheY-like chemotaxis protein
MATILAVDDDEKIRAILEVVLTNRGHHLVTARSGSEALEAFRRERPLITILDLQLPDVNGLSVLQEIRALDPAGLAIILTGADTAQLEDDARRLGAAEILQKGLSLHTIGDTVSRLLAQLGVTPHASFPREANGDAMPQLERRKHPRLPVQLHAELSRDGIVLGNGEIVDLSLAGCALRTAATVERGDYLALQVTNPIGQAAQNAYVSFICDLAVVRWVSQSSCGLEFIMIPPENKDRLHRYVKMLQEQERTSSAPSSVFAGGV